MWLCLFMFRHITSKQLLSLVAPVDQGFFLFCCCLFTVLAQTPFFPALLQLFYNVYSFSVLAILYDW